MKRGAVHAMTEAGRSQVAPRSSALDGRRRALPILRVGRRRLSELPQTGDDAALDRPLGEPS